jgi:hypothetical protein
VNVQASTPKKINDTGPLGYYNLPLNMVKERFQADAAALWLIHDQPPLSGIFACGQGFRFPSLASLTVRSLEKVVERAAFERRFLSTPIPGPWVEDPAGLDLVVEEAFTSAVFLPLETSGRMLGVLGVFYRMTGPNAIPEDSLRDLPGSILASVMGNSEKLGVGLVADAQVMRDADTTFLGWTSLIDMRLPALFAHCRRVARVALRLGEALKVSHEELACFYRSALLHDLGKISLPDGLLQAQPPHGAAAKLLSRHPELGREMLADAPRLQPILAGIFEAASEVAAHHHERWDGAGFPDGLKGEEIPLAARVVAVADEWDKTPSGQALRNQAGKRFDPRVVAAFLNEIL